mmetsp:Transcript_12027/g.26744  ORF Transcript_12027/g.26744 Transcript_12027/m.26744 type:complete len:346 (+) Transcript_12027:1294-2331(+)
MNHHGSQIRDSFPTPCLGDPKEVTTLHDNWPSLHLDGHWGLELQVVVQRHDNFLCQPRVQKISDWSRAPTGSFDVPLDRGFIKPVGLTRLPQLLKVLLCSLVLKHLNLSILANSLDFLGSDFHRVRAGIVPVFLNPFPLLLAPIRGRQPRLPLPLHIAGWDQLDVPKIPCAVLLNAGPSVRPVLGILPFLWIMLVFRIHVSLLVLIPIIPTLIWAPDLHFKLLLGQPMLRRLAVLDIFWKEASPGTLFVDVNASRHSRRLRRGRRLRCLCMPLRRCLLSLCVVKYVLVGSFVPRPPSVLAVLVPFLVPRLGFLRRLLTQVWCSSTIRAVPSGGPALLSSHAAVSS